MKATNVAWVCSLIVLGICTVFLAGAFFFSLELPDLLVRCIGVIDLAALLVFGYAIGRKAKNKR